MEDGYYRRSVHQQGDGYQLLADAVARPILPYYPPHWGCTHGEGQYHSTEQEALDCPQYRVFMRQVR